MSAMPWTAVGEDTGEVIPVNHRPATTQHDTSRTEPASDRPFVRIAAVSGAIAPCALLAYLWANTHYERTGGVRGLLFLALCVSLILCGIAVMHILRCRVDERRNEQLRYDLGADVVAARASLKRHLKAHADETGQRLAVLTAAVVEHRQLLQDLAALPEDVRASVRAYSQQLDGACREMASRLGDHSREMHALVEGRLVNLEKKVDEMDEEYERGWVAGSAETAKALSIDGKVRQLPSRRTR